MCGDLDVAILHFRASLRTSRDEGGREGTAFILAALAEVEHARGRLSDAARLAGAANSFLKAEELVTVRPCERIDFDRFSAWLEKHRDNAGFSEAYSAGYSLDIIKAVEFGLSISG